MPFKEITTVVHDGPITPEDQFILYLSGDDYWCSVKFWSPAVKRFCLVPEKWPKSVRDAAKELCNEQSHRGRPGDIDQVTAWLPRGDHPLPTGRENVLVEVRYGNTLHSRHVILEGIVIGFTVLG